MIEGTLEGVRFQVFAPRKAASFRTVIVRPAGDDGPAIPVVALPDLLRLKLEAGGPKDLWDVARLMRRYPEKEAETVAMARELGIDTELARWMAKA